MAVTTPPAVTPYRLDSSARYLWMAGATAIAAGNLVPTRAELTASTTFPITKLMVDHPGFETGRDTTQVPLFGSDAFPQTVSGPRTAGSPALILKSSEDGVDGTDFISEGDIGFFVIMPGGDVEDYFCRVYKVKVVTVNPGNAVSDFGRDSFMMNLIDANLRAPIPAAS